MYKVRSAGSDMEGYENGFEKYKGLNSNGWSCQFW